MMSTNNTSTPFFTIGVDQNNAVAIDEHGSTLVSLPFENIDELFSDEFQEFITAAVKATLGIVDRNDCIDLSIDDARIEDIDDVWKEILSTIDDDTHDNHLDADLALALQLQEEEEYHQHKISKEQKVDIKTGWSALFSKPRDDHKQHSSQRPECMPPELIHGISKNNSNTVIEATPTISLDEHQYPSLLISNHTGITTPLTAIKKNPKTSTASSTTTQTQQQPTEQCIEIPYIKKSPSNDIPTYISTSPVSPRTLEYLRLHAHCNDEIPMELLGFEKMKDELEMRDGFLNSKDATVKDTILQRVATLDDTYTNTTTQYTLLHSTDTSTSTNTGTVSVGKNIGPFHRTTNNNNNKNNKGKSTLEMRKMMDSLTIPQPSLPQQQTTDNAHTRIEYCRKNIRKLVLDMIHTGWRPLPGRGGGHLMYQREIKMVDSSAVPYKQVLVLPHTPSDVRSIQIVHSRLQRMDREAFDVLEEERRKLENGK